jgi:predicted MFS family arabinose efflux permease
LRNTLPKTEKAYAFFAHKCNKHCYNKKDNKEFHVFMTQTIDQRSSIEQKHPTGINPRIFLLTLGMFALGTDAFVVAGVLPTIARETGVTEGLAGQLVTVFSLAYGFGAPFLAALISRLPRNRALIGALALFCLANVGSALAPTFPLLLLSRVLTGLFAATYAPLAYATATSLAPREKRGQALSLVVIGLTVATVIGSPLGTWVGTHFGWRLSFGLVALLAAMAFVALLLGGLPKAEPSPTISLQARLAPMTQPRLVQALIPSFFWNLGIYMVYTYVASLLQYNLHLVDISGLLMVYGLGAMLGTLLAGKAADRFGENRPLLLILGLLILIQIALPWATSILPVALPALLLWGLLASLTFIPQQHRLLRLAPEHTNVILALNNSMFYLGIAAGSALGGLALRAVPVTELGWMGAACILLALVLFASSILSERKMSLSTYREREEVIILPE